MVCTYALLGHDAPPRPAYPPPTPLQSCAHLCSTFSASTPPPSYLPPAVDNQIDSVVSSDTQVGTVFAKAQFRGWKLPGWANPDKPADLQKVAQTVTPLPQLGLGGPMLKVQPGEELVVTLCNVDLPINITFALACPVEPTFVKSWNAAGVAVTTNFDGTAGSQVGDWVTAGLAGAECRDAAGTAEACRGAPAWGLTAGSGELNDAKRCSWYHPPAGPDLPAATLPPHVAICPPPRCGSRPRLPACSTCPPAPPTRAP